jgi:hypothetical protein
MYMKIKVPDDKILHFNFFNIENCIEFAMIFI